MSSRALPWLAFALGLVLAGAGFGSVALATPARSLPPTVVAPGPPPESALSPVVTAPAGPPTRLRVPVIGVDAAVVPVVVDPAGALGVPDDPRVVGWWNAGARPGAAAGPVVLDGHVDTYRDGPGALFHLADLLPGDEVLVDTAEGGFRYVVHAVARYPKGTIPAEVFAPGPPRVVLISCGGTFDRRLRHYADNVVVGAVESLTVAMAGRPDRPAIDPGQGPVIDPRRAAGRAPSVPVITHDDRRIT